MAVEAQTSRAALRNGGEPGPPSRAPLFALALAMAAAAALTLVLVGGLTFFQDTWAFLMHRQDNSLNSFFEPHNEHIVVLPVALEKLWIAVFGMTTALPELLALIVALLVTAGLLYLLVAGRLGQWAGVGAAVLVLFLGPAWQVLLWPFEIALVGSMGAGLGVLLALERRDGRGDGWACALVAVSILFSSLGLSFAFAAFVDVVVRHRERGWRRLWVPLVPGVFYLGWYGGWGHDAETHFSAQNVVHSPVFVVESVGSSLQAAFGWTAVFGVGYRPYAGLVVLALMLLAAWHWRSRLSFRPELWPLAAAAFSFWFLAAFNRSPARDATSNRYMHAGTIFVLLLAAEILRRLRPAQRLLWAGGVVVVAAAALNLMPMIEGQEELSAQTVLTRSSLTAMDIAERTLSPGFDLTDEIAGTPSLIDVNAPEYLEAKASHGTPAYSLSELEGASETARARADLVLAAALPLGAAIVPDAYEAGVAAGCRPLPDSGAGVTIAAGTAKVEVAPGAGATLRLRRFATGEFPVVLPPAPGGSVIELTIPTDEAPAVPWRLEAEGAGASLCST